MLQVTPVVGIVILVSLMRYVEPLCCLTPTRPPPLIQVVIVLCLFAILSVLIYRTHQASFTIAGISLILFLFILLKTDRLAEAGSAILRLLQGQERQLASATDLRWLGYSYLAFRLLHVLRDFQLGKTYDYNLEEFIIYGLFFPALTAGPIDRAPRFLDNLRQPAPLSTDTLYSGGQRIILGIFKKFVLADSLALFALSTQNAPQVTNRFWAWVLLYAYSLRVYFDFAGYTDIALGLAKWMGIHLPENFTAPYLKANLTSFWNSWHITLAQWFRAYFFNPVTRGLRSRSQRLPVWMVILVGQTGTMLLIGLWHGITWNFALWGLWHAAGLFVHNRWSEWMRPRLPDFEGRPAIRRILSFIGWALTFHYVTLGWVWFALPDIHLSVGMFQKLFSL